MGSAFAEVIDSLIDTYAKCLSLLKGFRRYSKPNAQQARLGSSIRSDQAKIRRAFSSRLLKKGKTFKKGDSTARSAIRSLIRGLTKTLEGLIKSPSSLQDPVDYASLMSLSSASRREAIRTMSDLSTRIGYVRSSCGSDSKRSKSTLECISSKGRHRTKKKTTCDQTRGDQDDRQTRGGVAAKGEEKRLSYSEAKSTCTPNQRALLRKPRGANRHSDKQHRALNVDSRRVSIMTWSSDSTKLGEVRQPDRHQGSPLYEDGAHDVVYPIRPFATPPQQPKTRRHWWGMLRDQ